MDTLRVTIPLRYLPNVTARVRALNKKFLKRGAPPFELVEVSRQVKRLEKQAVAPQDLYPAYSGESIDIPSVTLDITGEPFKIPSHRLVGVFYRGEEGMPNRLKSFGDYEFTPEQQQCSDQCDHCQTARRRNVLFFLQDTTTQGVKQIGGDCAELYLGVSPARAVNTISLYEEAEALLRLMEGDCWDEAYDDVSGRQRPALPLDVYLSSVAASIRHYGWVSKSRAEEELGYPTSVAALDRLREHGEILPEDVELANLAILHWKNRFPLEEPQKLDEFDANLKLLAHSSVIDTKSVGRAAWMVKGYMGVLDAAARARQAALSTHQGKEGEPIETVLRLDRVLVFETIYGPEALYLMGDADGNAFTWKTKSRPDNFREGDIMSVRAKVKGHDEYKGVKQTVLSHVKPEFGFAEFPHSTEEWLSARTQAFLTALASGWFNKSLAKGVDVAAAMNESTPPVLGMLVDHWIKSTGMYREGAALAIKEAIKAGAEPALLEGYSFLGEFSLADAVCEHPDLGPLLEVPKKRPRKTPSSEMSL